MNAIFEIAHSNGKCLIVNETSEEQAVKYNLDGTKTNDVFADWHNGKFVITKIGTSALNIPIGKRGNL